MRDRRQFIHGIERTKKKNYLLELSAFSLTVHRPMWNDETEKITRAKKRSAMIVNPAALPFGYFQWAFHDI